MQENHIYSRIRNHFVWRNYIHIQEDPKWNSHVTEMKKNLVFFNATKACQSTTWRTGSVLSTLQPVSLTLWLPGFSLFPYLNLTFEWIQKSALKYFGLWIALLRCPVTFRPSYIRATKDRAVGMVHYLWGWPGREKNEFFLRMPISKSCHKFQGLSKFVISFSTPAT